MTKPKVKTLEAETNCPFCNMASAKLEIGRSEVTIDLMSVKSILPYYKCSHCLEQFSTALTESIAMRKFKEAYKIILTRI